MEYRIYAVGMDGHLQAPTVIECASDAEAVDRVKAMLDGLPIELWQGSRLVGWFQNTSTGVVGVRPPAQKAAAPVSDPSAAHNPAPI